MVTITLKNIPDELYEHIKRSAKANRRSINSELLAVLHQEFLSGPVEIEKFEQEARRIRELTAGYVISAEEIDAAKKSGRE